MKNLDKKLAIYIAERKEEPQHSNESVAYHTFFLLVDENTEPVSILQQLHFNDGYNQDKGHFYLLPNACKGISNERSFNNVMAYPLIGGHEYDILSMWNYALSYASYVKVLEPEFSSDYLCNPKAVNCRAGVVAVLRLLNIDFDFSLFSRNAGTQCEKLPITDQYNNRSHETRSRDALWAVNTGHLVNLEPPWSQGERYVGPLKHPFLRMDPTINPLSHSFE